MSDFGPRDPETRRHHYEKFLRQHEEIVINGDTEYLEIPIRDLKDYSDDLYQHLIKHPRAHMESIKDTVDEIRLPDDPEKQIELNYPAIIVSFSDAPDEMNMPVGGYISDFANTLVKVEGTCRAISDPGTLDVKRIYECRRCGSKNTVTADKHTLAIEEPHECIGCERQGPFKVCTDLTERVDYQVVKIDEPADDKFGESNRSTTIDVELVGQPRLNKTISEGDRIEIVGVVMLTAKDSDRDRKGYNKHWVDGLHLTHAEDRIDTDDLTEGDIQEIHELVENKDVWDLIRRSIAPGLKGVDQHKEAVAMTLFADPDHTGTCNIMLWGEPGEGKSELMDAADEIASKSLVVDGGNASAVGLTAATEYMEIGGTRVPYAAPGALSMASGGICGIDEFDKMNDEVFYSLLRALEKGEITVTKGGNYATLPARANVIVTANPKGGCLDPYIPYAEQFNFKPYVLSRFDMIQVFEENTDEETLAEVMHHFMDEASGVRVAADGGSNIIDYDLLRKWIVYAQGNFDPVFEPGSDVRETMIEEFVDLTTANSIEARDDEDEKALKVDKRDGRALIKLAQIIARIHLCDEVKPDHAQKAIQMKLDSMKSVGVETMNLAKDEKDVTQTDNAELVKSIIEKDDLTREEVISEAHVEGLGPSETAHELEKLHNRGLLWERDNKTLGLLN